MRACWHNLQFRSDPCHHDRKHHDTTAGCLHTSSASADDDACAGRRGKFEFEQFAVRFEFDGRYAICHVHELAANDYTNGELDRRQCDGKFDNRN